MARLVLASASPRRRQLLAAAGWTFEVVPGNADETPPPGAGPEDVATALAERKARAVALTLTREPALVIGADTVVALEAPGGGTRLLGKPEDRVQARAMLAALSGSRHRVVTGVCVLEHPSGRVRTAWERTWVTMRRISEEELATHVASGGWRDKAGGYGIQEEADAFVTSLEEGGRDNVVGLPVALTGRLLRAAGG